METEGNVKQHITWVEQLFSISAPPSETALCQTSAILSNVNKLSPMISWTSFWFIAGFAALSFEEDDFAPVRLCVAMYSCV